MRPTRYEFLIVGLLTLFWGTVGLNRFGIGMIFPVIVPEFQLAGWQMGFLISGTSVTWAIASWIGGYLSDRHGRRRVLLPAVGFVGLMTGAMGLAQGFLSMFLVRDLLGIGDGVGWSVGQATINEESAPHRRGINQAIFTLGYTLIGVGLGAYIITRMTNWLGWRAVFPLIGLVTLLIFAALSLVMREPPSRREATADWRSALGLLRNPSLVFITVAGCAVLSWLQICVGFNVLYLTKIRGFDLVDAGLVASGWGFAGAAGQILVPLASDHFGRRPVVFVSALASAAALALYLAGGYGFWPIFALMMICGFCGFGLLPVVLATCVSETVSDEIRGAALGMTNFFGVIIGTTLMPLVGGVLVDLVSLTATLGIAVVAQLVVAASMLMIKETAPRIVASGEWRIASSE
ncbi:Predicted arabinose efflux permease, MFS family [Rhizobiales bacterium GAS191]|nr:Predicted arabinose efflux permease, MFS family [Rhizobiales bacterium GAS113]SED25072.1 Predicted arabinose efflux permease, MFS family [Rhizobiales bacterium GAS191]